MKQNLLILFLCFIAYSTCLENFRTKSTTSFTSTFINRRGNKIAFHKPFAYKTLFNHVATRGARTAGCGKNKKLYFDRQFKTKIRDLQNKKYRQCKKVAIDHYNNYYVISAHGHCIMYMNKVHGNSWVYSHVKKGRHNVCGVRDVSCPTNGDCFLTYYRHGKIYRVKGNKRQEKLGSFSAKVKRIATVNSELAYVIRTNGYLYKVSSTKTDFITKNVTQVAVTRNDVLYIQTEQGLLAKKMQNNSFTPIAPDHNWKFFTCELICVGIGWDGLPAKSTGLRFGR